MTNMLGNIYMNKTAIVVVLILVAAYFVADYNSPLNRCIRGYVFVNKDTACSSIPNCEAIAYLVCTENVRK